MGSLLSQFFVDPSELPGGAGGFIQLLFLMLCYAFILFNASHMISDGSELLLLVPALSGIVGSVVLPVLGAVPDGAIVLFSGMGSNAQEELSVGVGALAGSTIMLLTIPWAACIYQGRVDIKNGECVYKVPNGQSKLTAKKSFTQAGVVLKSSVKVNARIMFITAISYLWIQVPVFGLGGEVGHGRAKASSESVWALIGLLFSFLFFIAYLVWQVYQSNNEIAAAKLQQVVEQGIKSHYITLSAALSDMLQMTHPILSTAQPEPQGLFLTSMRNLNSAIQIGPIAGTPRQPLQENTVTSIHIPSEAPQATPRTLSYGAILPTNATPAQLTRQESQRVVENRFRATVRHFFKIHDRDHSGFIDRHELSLLLADLGENLSAETLDGLFADIDKSKDGKIDFNEFNQALLNILRDPKHVTDITEKAKKKEAIPQTVAAAQEAHQEAHPEQEQREAKKINTLSVAVDNPEQKQPTSESEEEEEEEPKEEDEEVEIPEDLQQLTKEQQQTKIKLRAAWMMTIGTALVLIFSDPMVDCLNNLGKRMNISPFYVAFILAPLASNASELIASVQYAKKKTPGTIAISFASLLGAASMNNTFCLFIFLILIYSQSLVWEFAAETMTILLVEIVVGLLAMFRSHHTLLDAIIILAMYPISLAVCVGFTQAGLN